MIAHLAGRERALEPFGWTGREAEWIALACLHSGVFIRAQATRFLDTHHERARRLVRAIGRVCRVFGRRLYRALGAEDIRHRWVASPTVLMRRLLPLDYVLEHPDMPWLPTEPEKVGAFEALGIERRLLPSRLYRGAAGSTRRYFPLKLPVALGAGRALFVYAEPGHDTRTALRSWGAAHRGLWIALAERGRSVEVVAIVRTDEELDLADPVLRGWAQSPGSANPDARIREEFGGLQGAMKRSVTLEKQVRRRPGKGVIRRASTWRTTRLARALYR